ncbi:MAG: hypothetical protein H7329_16160 [Opitutaceae bacterium]|nr:hypothetical protein [Cytophagales bacterium]
MKGLRKKYYASLLLMFSVLVLSSKDTLSMLHEIAHLIPNPFHNHASGNGHSHHFVRHNVLDHLKTKREIYAKLKSPQTEKKQEKKADNQDLKYKYYTNSDITIDIFTLYIPIRYYSIPTKFISFIFSPLAPPPKA